jgi:hypothetical protein
MTDTPKKKPALNRSTIATAILFLIVMILWRDQSRMKDDLLDMAQQKQQVQQQLDDTQSQLTEARSELDFFKTGDTGKTAEPKSVKPTPKTPEPEKEPENLILQPPSVSQTEAGLTARLVLEPTDSGVPDLVALVVRLPGRSDSVITAFRPVDEAAYANVKSRIDESGRFAIFQGSPSGLDTLAFDLTVSAPVTATVRGTQGIKPFQIDIHPGNLLVRDL